MLFFIHIRRCGDKQHLVDLAFKLLKVERTVIQCRWQPESVIHQSHFSGAVARIHSAHLRHRDMGLVNDDQIIILKIIHQGMRRCPRRKPGKRSRIVFDAAAESGLF